MRNYVFYDPNEKEIRIRGISISRLKNRVTDTFSSSNMVNPVNGAKYLQLFNKMEYISWAETEITFYSFFALEIYEMFTYLAESYNDIKYADVADELYKKTWISQYEHKDKVKMDTIPLMQFVLKPEEFQLEFIKNYPSLKFQYDLEGYILSFEQGLGKTFTSVAIGECLKKEIFYIVCPNSLKEVWANEIKKYYRKYVKDENLWKDEVFVSGVAGFKYDPKKTKFIIVNQESIPNIFPYVKKGLDSIIIIDESHNFRGIDTKRVESMIKLKEMTKCKDTLLMSGTPIKATASEIIPSLRMIDPHFTPRLANLYNKTFSSTSVEGASIAKARFKRIIYRKMKRDVLKLPEKYVNDLKLKVPRPERYSTSKAHKDIMERYHKEYIERLETGLFTTNKISPFYRSSAPGYNFIDEQIRFENIVRRYSRAKNTVTEAYLDKIFQRSEDGLDYKLINAQNVEHEYFEFLNKYVVPFVPATEKEYVTTRFNGIFGWAVAAKAATGTAIGKVTAAYKNACFSEIWKYNYQEIIDMILRNDKKTVIFSALVPTIDYIAEDLEKRGIEVIKVTGTNTGRMNAITEFQKNDKVQVLCATVQTLSTGVTLTEANQMFFFGTPYRSADFDQACDRIHRIGQDSVCYIYNVLLWSQEKNVTGRIEEILNWSSEMFDSLINENYII